MAAAGLRTHPCRLQARLLATVSHRARDTALPHRFSLHLRADHSGGDCCPGPDRAAMAVSPPVAADVCLCLSLAGLDSTLGRDRQAPITRARCAFELGARRCRPSSCGTTGRGRGLRLPAPTPLAQRLTGPTSGTLPAHAGRSVPWPRHRTPAHTPPPWPRHALHLQAGVPARTPG